VNPIRLKLANGLGASAGYSTSLQIAFCPGTS
jgi:hypothetical protein